MRSLDRPAGRGLERRHDPVGERKYVAVLFADVVGFTSISEQLGEEGAFALIQPVRVLMQDVIGEHGGTVMDFAGDGVMAVFGAPISLEDAPIRACRAALALHERIAHAEPPLPSRPDIRPKLRIGINTGPVIVGHLRTGATLQLTAVGDTVNSAARLQALAEPGDVVLSESAQQNLDGLVVSEFVGAHVVKGKTAPQNVYRLEAVIENASRFDRSVARGLTRYVGRLNELDLMSVCRDAALAGSVQVIDIAGEPGIGKSRLLHEFGLRHAEPQRLSTGHCSLEGRRTAYLPFIAMVRGSFGIQIADDRDRITVKLDEGLRRLGTPSPERLALLGNLLASEVCPGALDGLDPVLVGLRTRDLLIEMIQAWCRTGLTILYLEDVHWLDSASEELLGRLIAHAESASLLIVHTRRPEYLPAWIGRANVRTLALEPLNSEEIALIVRQRLGDSEVSGGLVERIVDQADGNALFAEEIAGFLIAREALAKPASGLPLPVDIQAIFGAAIDALAVDERRLLQIASVIGRQFNPALLLAAATELRIEAVSCHLEALTRTGLLQVDGRTGEVAFRHALLRDVLYDSMLAGLRASFHLAIATQIDHQSDRIAELSELLAHHYGRASRNDMTFFHAATAAKKNLRIYALKAAREFAEMALGVLSDDPDAATDAALAELLADHTLVLQLDYDVPRLVQSVEAWLPRIYGLGRHEAAAVVLHHYANALILAGRFRESGAISKTLDTLASLLHDDKSKLYAFTVRVWTGAILGPANLDALEAEIPAMLAAATRSSDVYLQVWLRWVLGFDAIHRGFMTRAYTYAEDLIGFGRKSNDPRATGAAAASIGPVTARTLILPDLGSSMTCGVRPTVTPARPIRGVHFTLGRSSGTGPPPLAGTPARPGPC